MGHTKIYKKDKIQFIYNGQKIRNELDTLIGEYFKQESNILIKVNDELNLLSINWNQKKNIIFQINDYYKQEFTFSNNDTLDCLLRTYLHKIDYDILKDNITI